MKNILCLLAILCVYGFSANDAGAQNNGQNWKTNFPKPQNSSLLKEYDNETEWSSDYDSKNKLELVKGSNIRNKTTAVLEIKKFRVKLSGELITPTKPNPDNIAAAFEVGVSKDIRSVDVSLINTFVLKHRKRFGMLEAGIGRTFHLAEEVDLRVSTSLTGVYALENSNNNVSSGIFSASSLEFEGKLGKGHLGIKPQIIFDNNSLHRGKRVAGNIEIKYLFHIGRVYLGPKVEFTNFLLADHESHLEKRNALIFGFIVKIK